MLVVSGERPLVLVAVDAARLVADDLAGAEPLFAGEEGAVKHMNEDHADAIALYATQLLGQPAADWRMTGLDPEGADLKAGALRARLEFPSPARSPGDIRRNLVELAGEARKRLAAGSPAAS